MAPSETPSEVGVDDTKAALVVKKEEDKHEKRGEKKCEKRNKMEEEKMEEEKKEEKRKEDAKEEEKQLLAKKDEEVIPVSDGYAIATILSPNQCCSKNIGIQTESVNAGVMGVLGNDGAAREWTAFIVALRLVLSDMDGYF